MDNGKVKKRRWLITSAVVVIGLIIGVIVWWNVRDQRDWEYGATRENEHFQWVHHVERSTLNGNDIVLVEERGSPWMEVSYDRRYMRGHHVLMMEGRYRRYGFLIEWLEIEAGVYDVFSEERIRTIDVLEVFSEIEQEIEGFRLIENVPMRVFERIDGEIFFSWVVFSNSTPVSVRLNNQTGHVSVHEDGRADRHLNERERDFVRQIRAFDEMIFADWEVGEQNFLERNGIGKEGLEGLDVLSVNRSELLGTVTIRIPAILLPQESENLYGRFPNLRQFQGRESFIVHIILTDYPTPEEILEMLMEDGREISFEGLVMCGEYSIDGEEHEIHSFEDYIKWRDRSDWGYGEPISD